MTDPTVPVTQADIGWAESAAQHLCHPADRDAAVRLLADAFARHRIAARREGMEEAARIAWSHYARIPNHNPDVQRDDLVAQGYGNASLNIATAIRTAIEQGTHRNG